MEFLNAFMDVQCLLIGQYPTDWQVPWWAVILIGPIYYVVKGARELSQEETS